MPAIRIGIDVGGTFTHAVALDGFSLEVLAHSVVPTTHFAKEGVASGIVESLKNLLENPSVKWNEVTFIAHSTTQATNALLEGDVAGVGIVGMGSGLEARRARSETYLGNVKLFGGREIETAYEFIDSKSGLGAEGRDRIRRLKEKRAKAIVAAAAYSVDDPAAENIIVEASESEGLPAVATHEISGLYGLKARTRTAVVNASILPKMLEAAEMTERAVKESGIAVKLMVMRSDGGVLSLSEVRRRPILTMLSGPAAGVAAALMYEKISDGIFLEVGGTSTDITVIRDGRAHLRSAEIGGNKLYLRTLDVRTVGLAGGSMPRVRDGRIVDVGPRSAHIVGLPYSAFSKNLAGTKVVKFSPKPNDPDDYVFLQSPSGDKYAMTVTCAANALGIIPEGDWAHGDEGSSRAAAESLAKALGKDVDDVCREILDVAAKKFIGTIEGLIKEYKLSREGVVLVGGGGGAAAIVPYLAQKMKLPCRIAKNNPIISAIGVALAMLHETIERSVINPTEEDIIEIRHEAEEKVLAMGAKQETVEVQIEVDSRKNILRASAFGATERRQTNAKAGAGIDDMREAASKSMRISSQSVKLLGETPGFAVFGAEVRGRRLFGLLSEERKPVRIVDRDCVIRFQRNDAGVLQSKADQVLQDLSTLLESETRWGDAGERLPDIFVLLGSKTIDLSGLNGLKQMSALIELETRGAQGDEPVVILSSIS